VVTKARRVGSTVVSEQRQKFLLEYLEIGRRALLPTVDKQNVAPPTMKTLLRLFAIVLTLEGYGTIAQAQQPKKVFRIGYLAANDAARDTTNSEGIRLALRERGHIEGQNIAIEYRYAEGKPDRYSELAAELVRLNVDIIVVAGGSRPVRAAKNATKTIPIVMTGAGLDPVEAGLVESLARPGGNVTGLTLLSAELGGKRLELLKETVPKVARVAVLYDPAIPSNVHGAKEVLPAAARALRLTIQPWGYEMRTV
jgi:ABC-type uncharacterized transport system substrate-binding protein